MVTAALPFGDGEQPRAATLYLLARTKGIDTKKVTEIMKDGGEAAKCHFDQPEVLAVSDSFQREFEELVGRGRRAAAAAPAPAEVALTQSPNQPEEWQFRLPKREQFVTSLEVDFADEKAPKKFEPSADPKGALTRGGPASESAYLLRLPPNAKPLKYRLVVSELQAADRVVEGTWPVYQTSYLIKLGHFTGSKEEFFKAVQDADKVGNPLKIETQEDVTFVFANIGQTEGDDPMSFLENRYVVHPGDRKNARRVWLLFPVGEDQLAKVRADLAGKTAAGVIDFIRASKTVAADERAVVTDKSEPRWIEVVRPSERHSFERAIDIEASPELRKKYPRVWQIVVWEFEYENRRRALDVSGKYYREEEVKAWVPGLDGLLQKAKTAR